MTPELQPIVDFAAAALDQAGLDRRSRALTLAARAATPAQPADRPGAAEAPGAAAHVAAQLLPGALEAAARHVHKNVLHAIADLSDRYHWRQTAGYVSNPPHPEFLAAYAHTALVHRPASSPVSSHPESAAALGLLLLGAGNRYPHHQHPADEVYIPLTVGAWSSALDAPFADRAPGEPLHHRPHQPHALEAGSTPLLTIYLWTGDIETPAHFC